jgi:hypothetical protein
LTISSPQTITDGRCHKGGFITVWRRTLRKAEIGERGQYVVCDTIISPAPSSGMVLAGEINRLFEKGAWGESPSKMLPKASPSAARNVKAQDSRELSIVEAKGIEPPSGFNASRPRKCLFLLENRGLLPHFQNNGPSHKTIGKVTDNPRKTGPGPVGRK